MNLPSVLSLALACSAVTAVAVAQEPPPLERTVVVENVRHDYAQVLNVEPVFQVLRATRTEEHCEPVSTRTLDPVHVVVDEEEKGRLGRFWTSVRRMFGAEGDAVPAGTAVERTLAAAARAFAAFPHLQRIACTQREVRSVDAHTLGAVLIHRAGQVHRIEPQPVDGIVDRIGGGDAFTAGVLHGVLSGMDDGRALAFGLAAARLKHSVPGDFNLVGADDVTALVDSGRLDVKR